MDPFHAKIIAGATGATLTALTMTPFDVAKTRLQTQPTKSRLRPPLNACCQPTNAAGCVRNMSSLAVRLPPSQVVCVWDADVWKTERVRGALDTFRHVWRAEGFRGLWKGVGTSLIIGVPSSTSYILTYDYLVHQVLPPIIPSQSLAPLVAGVTARSIIATVASPLELVRTNLQATPRNPDQPQTLRFVLTSIRSLVKERGFFSLYRGLQPTLWRDTTFSGFYWANYEALKRRFKQNGYEGVGVAFFSGATSGTLAALLTSPFDVLKTRRQALLLSPTNAPIPKTIPLLLHVIRTEGPAALYAGITPRIVKIAPACGLMISCFEGIGKLLTKTSD